MLPKKHFYLVRRKGRKRNKNISLLNHKRVLSIGSFQVIILVLVIIRSSYIIVLRAHKIEFARGPPNHRAGPGII
jgi:hypothetical protein